MYIEWVDATLGNTGWWDIEDVVDMALETVHSTGWLISEDDQKVLLCQSLDRISSEPVHVQGMVVIPVSNIVKKDVISSL